MRIITYTIILSFTIFNPTQAWWSWIEDTVNTIKTAAGEFASWGDALTDANIPILSDVAGAADIYKGWVEDGFDKATGELGVDFEDALDLARRLVSLTDALPDISGAVKTALDPVFNEIKGKIDVVTDIPKAIYYGTTNSRRRLNDDGNRNSSRRRLNDDENSSLSSIFGDIPGIGIAIEGVSSTLGTVKEKTEQIPGISHTVNGITTVTGNIKGLVDEIPFIGDDITNILNNGIPGLFGKLSNIQSVGIPGLSGQLSNIQSVGIPGLDGQLDTIIGSQFPILDGNIVDILSDVVRIKELLTNPFSVLQNKDNVKSLGNTIKMCIDELFSSVFEDIPFSDIFDAVHVLDIDFEAIIYEAAAIGLLPYQSSIEFICTHHIDKIVAVIKTVKDLPSFINGSAMYEIDNILAYNHDTNGLESTNVQTQSDWQSGLLDSIKINRVSIPGTHDTMSYNFDTAKWINGQAKDETGNVGGGALATLIDAGTVALSLIPVTADIVDGLTRCQQSSLSLQLEAGIRALDMRCVINSNGGFDIYHGSMPLEVDFDYVLDVCTTFLRDHPDEFILMRVTDEADASVTEFSNVFDTYWNSLKYSPYFYNTPNFNIIPSVAEVRGKIFILQKALSVGFDYNTMNIQDEFALTDQWALYDKWVAVKNHINNAVQSNVASNEFYMNYMSGSMDVDAFTNFEGTVIFPWYVASGHITEHTESLRMPTTFQACPEKCDEDTFPYLPCPPRCDNNKYPDFPRQGLIEGRCLVPLGCPILFEGTNELAYDYIAEDFGFIGMMMMDFPGQGLIDKIINLNSQKTMNQNHDQTYGIESTLTCTPDVDGFCESAQVSYNAWDSDNYGNIGTTLVSKLLVAAGCFDATDDKWYQKKCFATTKLLWYLFDYTLDQVKTVVDGSCNAAKEAASNAQASAQPAMMCVIPQTVIKSVKQLSGRVLWFINFHHEQLSAAKGAALQADRKNIINNQYALKEYIDKRIDELQRLIQTGTLGTMNAIDNKDLKFKLLMKKINALQSSVDELKVTPVYAKKNEMNIDHDVEPEVKEVGLIHFTLKMTDMYIFMMVLFGWTIVFVMIGVGIGKCIFGDRSKYEFSKVPKYDYSTSDIEDTNT